LDVARGVFLSDAGEMKLKRLFLVVLLALYHGLPARDTTAKMAVVRMDSGAEAVDTRQIDAVLKKVVLNNDDLKIIDEFMGEAVRELVQTKNLSDIAKNRTVILIRQSEQGQYAQQFSESAHKHIYSGLQEASEFIRQTDGGLTPEGRKVVVTVNLLILIDELEDPRLADLAISKLTDKSMVVRYWAVHCITTPSIIKKLNSGGASNLELARSIATKLSKLVESSSPEIIALIAKFAANVEVQEAEDLLLQIADIRIKKYADWSVKYELLDDVILKSLTAKIANIASAYHGLPARDTTAKMAVVQADIASRFGQLYSYVIQRYIKSKSFLSDDQKYQLVSIMVETEDKCISKLLGRTQTGIKRAIETDDTIALLREHDKLLGCKTAAGQLPLKLEFEYGSTGGSQTAPVSLPEPP